MTWSYQPVGNDTTRAHVVLQFVNYPDYMIGVHSTDLPEKLEASGVKIIVTADFGVMRGFELAQIGPITQWSTEASYTAGTDNTKAPPWMQ